MLNLFLLSLFGTFIVVRILAHTLHDRENFGTRNEKSLTLTFFFRKRLNLDIHHIHLGFILLFISATIVFTYGTSDFSTILLGSSLSLILDQIVPFFGNKNGYFSLRRIIESLVLHFLAAYVFFRIS